MDSFVTDLGWIFQDSPKDVTLHTVFESLTHTPNTTHGDSSQQSLGHICHDDANQEDDGLQPGVAQDERQDEEAHAQEDGYARDDVDEMFDLDVDGRTADLELWRQGGDATHHCSVPSANHDAMGRTWEGGGDSDNQVHHVFHTLRSSQVDGSLFYLLLSKMRMCISEQ